MSITTPVSTAMLRQKSEYHREFPQYNFFRSAALQTGTDFRHATANNARACHFSFAELFNLAVSSSLFFLLRQGRFRKP
jgi:hypothetical protein